MENRQARYPALRTMTLTPVRTGPRAADLHLPVSRFVVLEELAPDMRTRVESADDRIDDARGAVDDIERRMKTLLDDLACSMRRWILVRDPTGILSLIHISEPTRLLSISYAVFC